jgi:TolA-binding protein
MRRSIFPIIAAGGLLLAVGCQSEEALKKVEQEVSDLKIEVFKMRREMEDANRKAEAERTEAEQARKLDRRFQADLQDTLRQFQESARVLNNRLQEAPRRTGKASTQEPGPATSSDDEKAFNSVLLDYNRGSYALAVESLDLFLKSNPQSIRRPDALFYLGLSHYNLKAYDKAKGVFEQILKDFPSSSQFLPARLKRAQCLKYLGLKPGALKAFQEITEGFPGTSEARTAQQELEDLGF